MSYLNQNEEFKEGCRDRMIKIVNNPELIAKSHLKSFLTLHDDKESYFYVMLSKRWDGGIKFGITQITSGFSRIKRCYSYRILYSGDKESVAKLEYLIKIELKFGEWVSYENWNKFKDAFRKSINEL